MSDIIKKRTTRKGRMTGKKMVLRLTAWLLSIGLSASAAVFLIKSIKEYLENKYKGTAYVYNIENDGKLEVRDEFGDVLEIINLEDGIGNLVISTEKIGKYEDEQQPVFVLDDDGNIVSGYIDTSDIERRDVTKIREFFSEDADEVKIGIVSATNGALAQQDKETKHSDDGELLAQGTYILCGNRETSKDNAYTWRKILYFKDGEIAEGAYIDDNDILNIEDLDGCRKIKVTNEFLRVRRTPNIDVDNVQYQLNQGEIVYQVPNIAEKKDKYYDWIPIVYRNTNTNSFELGWIAGIDRIHGEIYVEQVVSTGESEDSVINMCVDTSSVGGIDLKIREVPGINSRVIDSCQHGTEISITKESFENPYEVDGFGWGKLVDREGYVAIEYLREPEKTEEPSIEEPVLNNPQDTKIEMIVDTSSVGNADLKLREAPGTDAKIKMRLQDGTTVYTTQRFIDEAEKSEVIDGHKWIQVIAENGTTGVVAYDYIVDKRIEMIVDTSSVGNADLKLREAPGTDAKIKMRLQDGTTVYTTQRFIDEAEKSEVIDGHKWIQVIAEDGTAGVVAYDYVVKAERGEVGASTVEYREMDIPGKGKVEGVLILDSTELSVGDFEEILKGNLEIPGKYGKKPAGIIIKIGATGYGDTFSIATKQDKIDKARALMNLCERYGMMFGTYYYDQAINKPETDAEIDFILSVYSGMGELQYNRLGLAIDIENGPNGTCRMLKFAKQSSENRQYLTELKKYMMEELRKRTGQEVIIYSNKNELKSIIDYTKLSDSDLERMWLVNPSGEGHVKGLQSMGILQNSSFWQVELDKELPGYGRIDLSVMTKERFQELLRNGDIEIVFDEPEQESER